MDLKLTPYAKRFMPTNLYDAAAPALAKIDQAFSGDGDDAVSARIAIFVFFIRIFSAAIAYFSQVFLARWMGNFEYGIFVAVWVAAVIIGGIACLGLQTSVIRFISEYRASKENDFLRGAIFGSLSWAFMASSLIAIMGSVGVYVLSDWFSNYYIIPIYLAAVCLPMLALQEVQDGVARAHNWPGVALAPTFLARPVLIMLFMVAAIVADFPVNAETAMVSTILATYISATGQLLILNKRLKKAVPTGPRRYQPMAWMGIAIPIFLVEGFYNLLTNVDIMFVSHFMTPEDAGIYFAAVKTLALVHFVYFAVKASAAHRFSTYLSSGDHKRYSEFIQQTVQWTFWPSLVFALFMLVAGKYFLMLFGEAFLIGETVIWILAIGIIVRSSVGPAESVLTMSGEQNSCAWVYAVTLFVNIIMNCYLIPRYGLNGAAIATTLAMFFESAALFALAKRRLGLHIFIIPQFDHNAQSKESAK